MTQPALANLARQIAGPFAFVGLAVRRGTDEFQITTAPGMQADRHTLFRVASISKIVTARTYLNVAVEAGITDPLDLPFAEATGWRLARDVTLGQLLSHTSGLDESAGYLVPPEANLQVWATEAGDSLFGPHAPGTAFAYANLGYILIAAATEAIADDRFDRLAARHVLTPLRVSGGFNWSGVPALRRAASLPTFRRGADGFVAQIDADLPETGIVYADERLDLSGYRPGQNPAVFSPQGGLRASLEGLLSLAVSLEPEPPVWRAGDGPMEDPGGVFQHYGCGLQIFDTAAFYPGPLIGHFANAYGFQGGCWRDPARDISFAYALNGIDEEDDDDAFSEAEQIIFAAIAAL